ncbi:MAG: hypothetical protein COW24_04280 [Candidatus Kerfeldbacteria bacterium CG15_BIG_FIL_POST_REV_8_21_14_020_45_12]|uniref:Transcription regulator TrmB N-terminal domain-containing protein n=1 Tax=Candidatus Kerfeldbacteria bacterium CG15_BIG_FIL_POST_REV_8_21_14_020_45_12 TaxID=2014247 RepID=A0A2M7H373_9BACT|nr:MAG: hypothetical protein COW24_04280 [Candidatus Kerfeldbacteria bacterium CG15_BIG_FIL_POST_REV_8_21_14_020_45_12]PJA93307.1 MAG: hypothetical protein CO132_03705 [Candidatus Kerfeldbacteria bacterium CG_4_9_14_3_um_filter_45_8]
MKNSQLTELLHDLGFGQNESIVYLALVESGQNTAGKLIKATGLHRHIVYESLKSLEGKHLASSSKKNNVSVFQATDPKRLIEQFDSRRTLLEEAVKTLQTKHTAAKPEVVTYEGAAGPKAVLSEMLAAGIGGETVYGIYPNTDMFQKNCS